MRSKGCGKKRCEVCETDIFSSAVTGATFKINHKLNRDNKCLIYLFTCDCCGKQYVGETTREFRFRWNNYKPNDWKYTRSIYTFSKWATYRFPSLKTYAPFGLTFFYREGGGVGGKGGCFDKVVDYRVSSCIWIGLLR